MSGETGIQPGQQRAQVERAHPGDEGTLDRVPRRRGHRTRTARKIRRLPAGRRSEQVVVEDLQRWHSR